MSKQITPAVPVAAGATAPADVWPPRAARAWSSRLFATLFLACLFLPLVLFAGDKYWLPVFTRYMALALFALSVDLIWGYTGLLSLGQGLFFGCGVYAIGYCLKLDSALLQTNERRLTSGQPPLPPGSIVMPDFMAYCRLEAVPSWVTPFANVWFALAVAILLPTLIAALFGLVIFKLRIKGVYFSLITQALLLAVFTLIINQQAYTGGVVGMTYLADLQLFGYRFKMAPLYLLVTGTLIVCYLGCAWLMSTKFGQVLQAIRDNEYRVQALGYDTALYKTFIFALAGMLAGVAGALYAASLGTTGPDTLNMAFSIEIVIFVAVGGRGTLLGAILGAVLVNMLKTFANDNLGKAWPIILGSLFILVVALMPNGILGLVRQLSGALAKRFLTRADPLSSLAVASASGGQLPMPASVSSRDGHVTVTPPADASNSEIRPLSSGGPALPESRE